MRVLFLDDDKQRHKDFRSRTIGLVVDQAYTAQEAIDYLKKNQYDAIFLDHDLNYETNNQLNDDEEDGRFVAKYLATQYERCKASLIVIHSLNFRGACEMREILMEGGFASDQIDVLPFAWQKVAVKDGHLCFGIY